VSRIFPNVVLGFVFLFFALERITVTILHSIIELITQTKFTKLDSVIGSVGALSYGVIGILLLVGTTIFGFYFWFTTRKVSAVYCLKLVLSQLVGFTIAVIVSTGI
jgi:hypothetical protein